METRYLKNPSGVIVEIDDEEQFRKCLSQKGFDLASEDEIKAYKTKKQVGTEQDTSTSVYFKPMAGTADGYGQMVGPIIDSLHEYGINLNSTYTGQQVGLAFGYPDALNALETEKKVLFTMFESTKIPDVWKDDLEQADEIIVPSSFCYEAFKDAGFETTVIPLGYNSKIFQYEAKDPDKEPFTFVHYNAFNQRKGWDIVFKAFNEEFEGSAAKLILKTTFENLPFPIPKSQYPNIEVIQKRYEQEELAELLHQSDCFVFPSRGEGFGITPLEALATGTPAIVPDAHGISQYFTRNYFFEVEAEGEVPALYKRWAGEDVGKMIEPDKESLKRQMRFVFEHRTYAFNMAQEGSQWVKREYPLKSVASRLAAVLNDLEMQKLSLSSPKSEDDTIKQSIIVLSYNGLKYTKACLKSVAEHTENFELIVVDNGSDEETVNWLKRQDIIDHLVLNEENKGVAGGRNIGIQKASAEIVTFLDNDTEVKEGWQEAVLSEFKDETVGVVGKDGSNVDFLKPVLFSNPPYVDGRAQCDVVSGFCFNFRRDLVGIIGPLYEGLPNEKFWHEDLDFCLRVQLAGYRVIVKDIPIFHHEHKSMGEGVVGDDSVDAVSGFYENGAAIAERLVGNNMVYFYRDWGGFNIPDSYDKIAKNIAHYMRKEGTVVIRKNTVPTAPASFNLCKGFDIFFKGKRYILLHQENDRCPQDWQKAMRHVDHAFTVSPHVMEACKDEPYYDKLLNVSLDGINKEIYNFDVEPLNDFYPDKFKFLMVGATQPRKNTKKLIKHYNEVFDKDDDVVLIIKDFGYGHSNDTTDYIDKITDENSPQIEYIYDNWDEDYLAQVYKTVGLNGAYIHPHKAEAFGLPLVEAVACGCRVGTTNWGGPKYTMEGIATYFDYELEESSFHNNHAEPYYQPDENPQWAEPKATDVKKFMIDILREKYDEDLAKENSQKIINKYDYKVVAKKVKETLWKN